MKIIVFLFLLIPAACFCQKNDPENLPAAEYELMADNDAPASLKLPFSSIKVIDSRFDTSKLGFVYSYALIKSKKRLFKKAVLKNGIANAITQYYNSYYKNSFSNNGFELMVVMKKFWMSQTELVRSQDAQYQNGFEFKNIYIKWEYYLGKDNNYLPVKRIDTVIEVNKQMANYIQNGDETAPLALLRLVLKAQVEFLDFSKATEAFDNQPKKTMEWISNYNNSRFDIPILKTDTIRTGVYMHFSDFLKNSPVIESYQEKSVKHDLGSDREEFISDNKGNEIFSYWGYYKKGVLSIGKKEHGFIFRNGECFQFFHHIVNTYKTTDPLGSMNTRTFNGNYDNYSPTVNTHITVEWVPYQLDMETGKFY